MRQNFGDGKQADIVTNKANQKRHQPAAAKGEVGAEPIPAENSKKMCHQL